MTAKPTKPAAAKRDRVPTSEELTAIGKALTQKAANTAPRLKLLNNQIYIDHPDPRVGEQLMMKDLGTNDRDFMYCTFRQMANAASSQGQPADETDLNSMLSVVRDIRPTNQIEAMLAVQMAIVHTLAMRYANYLVSSENISQQDSGERIFSKLTRTFPVQIEALKRVRSTGEQNITVQNVSIEDGVQAIVGNVTHHAGEVAPDKASPQAITDAGLAPIDFFDERVQPPLTSNRRSDK